MLAKLAAPVGKLQVEITRTIVGCNCCPNVDCSLIKILLKEMRMLLMLPIKRSSPGNTVLVTADEAMSSFASGRFRGRRVAAVLWRSTQILSSSKLSEPRTSFYKLLLGSKNWQWQRDASFIGDAVIAWGCTPAKPRSPLVGTLWAPRALLPQGDIWRFYGQRLNSSQTGGD